MILHSCVVECVVNKPRFGCYSQARASLNMRVGRCQQGDQGVQGMQGVTIEASMRRLSEICVE
jgi:hypothetical protein